MPGKYELFVMAKSRLILVFLLFSTLLHAQVESDTTMLLPRVLISKPRLERQNAGANIRTFDSLSMRSFTQGSLSNVLSSQSQVYLKNYGPGQLSSSSIRGGSAQHTQVIWQGFNLQNPMLGQVDLSQFQVALFDGISVQYGGNTALWGSGAIGGSIHLNNELAFNHAMQVNLQTTMGSNSDYRSNFQLRRGGNNNSLSLKAFYHRAKNDFKYLNNQDEKLRIAHNAVRLGGILGEYKTKIRPRQTLSTHIWYNKSTRELPITLGQNFSDAIQDDDALRLVLKWKKIGNNWVTHLKAGGFREHYRYQSEKSNLITDATSFNFLTEGSAVRAIGKKQSITLGINQQYFEVVSDAYAEKHTRFQTAGFGAWTFQNKKWKGSLSVRQVYYDEQLAPFVPSIGLDFEISDDITIKASVSRVFRLPTFNELYWKTGDAIGNSNLSPEKGWSQSLDLFYRKQLNSGVEMDFQHTFFNKLISNWILWESNSGIIEAQNLAEVWSRGFEERFGIVKSWNALSAKLNLSYDYTLASNQVAKRINDQSVGKQLIYVPKHKAGASLYLNWKQSYLEVFQRYNSKTYTSPDNLESLPRLFLTDMAFGNRWNLKRGWLGFQFKIYNLFNQNYQVITGRPMPGIRYDISFTYHFQEKKDSQ